MNIVLIPCYNRPDLLANTLGYIIEARDAENQMYVFCQDFPDNKEVTKLINQFPYLNHHLQVKYRWFEGNSYNIGMGLHYAEALTKHSESNLIYIIEEDVYIGRDFFDVHESLHQSFHPFAVSTCYNHFRKRQELFYNTHYVYKDSKYQQIGTSINIKYLPDITKHFNIEYYENPQGYCDKHFIKSDIPFVSSDGLIGKVMESLKQFCIYTFVPRSYHAGTKGINTYADEDIRPINLDSYSNPKEFEMRRIVDYKGY